MGIPNKQRKKPDNIKIPAHLSRKDLGDIKALAESIAQRGQLQDIGVDKNDNLIFGLRRLTAMKEMGAEWINVQVFDDAHEMATALLMELDENAMRKSLTPSEAVEMSAKIVEALARAEEKVEVPVPKGAVDPSKETVKLPVPHDHVAEQGKGFSKHERAAAKVLGVSPVTHAKAKQVVEAAKADPTLQPIADEMDRTGKVKTAHDKVLAAQLERTTKNMSLKDAAGVEIPPLLRDIFGDKKWIVEAVEACILIGKDIKRVHAAIQSKGPAYQWMKTSQALETLRGAEVSLLEVKELTEGNKPHVVCGECEGKGKILDSEKVAQACVDCNGCGWLPKWRYEELYDVD
jgi:ParB-like chromosome segregation protein Spo0J